MNREPCNQNNTIYHMKHYLYDIQSSTWGYFGTEWKRYCSFIIQANSSLEGMITLKVPLLVGTDFYVIQMPKDKFNDQGIVYKADMYAQNTFTTTTDSSFLILYEPTWYQAGYFQFYTFVDPEPPKDEEQKINIRGASFNGLNTENEAILANIKDGTTSELFQSTVKDLQNENRDQTFTSTTTIVSNASDENLEARSFKDSMTSPAKYLEPEINILGEMQEKGAGFTWSFSLTVAVVIMMIVGFLGIRYIYQKFVSKTLLSDQE